MEEQLISFETAKLAREKGFSEVCRQLYKDYGENDLLEPVTPSNYNNKDTYLNCASAPSQSLLQKWLREKHNIHVNPQCISYSGAYKCEVAKKGIFPFSVCGLGCEYEEALEVGLQEALKSISK